MNKVVTINLNGRAYQFDEDAYDTLRAYLDRAAAELATNPDKGEILADLEQAIADKCSRYLNAHKSVIVSSEIRQVLEEMGPVDTGADRADESSGARTSSSASSTSTNSERARGSAARRLYRIDEGAMIGGVCNGIAAFFGVDVTIVRVAFVVIAVLELASSHIGAVIIIYGVMMLVIPLAATAEEQAAAHGERFNAQEIIDRAKQNIAELNDRGWRRHQRAVRRHQRQWRRQQRQWRRAATTTPWSAWAPAPTADYGTRIAAGVMASVLSLANLLLLVTFIYALISLATARHIYRWQLPDNVPISMAIVGLVLTYYSVAWPLLMARRSSYYAANGSMMPAWDSGGYRVITAGLAALFAWLAYQHVPEFHDFVERLPAVWDRVREAFAHR